MFFATNIYLMLPSYRIFSYLLCLFVCQTKKKDNIAHRSYSELDFPSAVFGSDVILFVCLKFTFWFKARELFFGVVRIMSTVFPSIFVPSFVFMRHQRLVTELYHTFSVHFHENHENTLNYYRCHFNGLRLETVYGVTLLECLAAAFGKTLD